MPYIDQITWGGTTYDIQDSATKAVAEELSDVTDIVDDIAVQIGYNDGKTTPTYTPIEGKVISETGNEGTNANYNHSPFIHLGDAKSVSVDYTKSNQYVSFLTFYKENAAYTSYYVATNGTNTSITSGQNYSVPSDANYVVVAYQTVDFPTTPPIVTLYSDPSSTVEDIIDLDLSVEATPTITWNDGSYCNPSGTVGTSGSASRSDPIDVSDAKTITPGYTYAGTQYVSPLTFYRDDPTIYYPTNKPFVSTTGLIAGEPINVPADAKYAMLTIPTANKATASVTIQKSKLFDIEKEIDRLSNKGIGVFFGDSIVQGVGVLPLDGSVPILNASAFAQNILGGTIYNAGIGGTTLTTGTDANFCALVDAVTGETTWDAIDTRIAAIIAQNPTFGGLITTIGALKTLDFSTVDYVLIAYGTNDWASNRAIGDADSTNTAEFTGAFKYAIEKLLTAYPQIRVYMVAPGYRNDTGNGPADTHGGKTLAEYSTAICELSEIYGFPCLNLYTHGMVNEFNSTTWLTDKVHRTIKGYELLGQQYAKFIMNN